MNRLLEAGADPNKQYGAGWSPLHIAIEAGHLEAVKVIIPYSDRSLVLADGSTLLDIAKTEELRDFIQNYQDVSEISFSKEPDDYSQ